ncbi:hypothetical protein D3C75_1259400 [compost metagenome]
MPELQMQRPRLSDTDIRPERSGKSLVPIHYIIGRAGKNGRRGIALAQYVRRLLYVCHDLSSFQIIEYR